MEKFLLKSILIIASFTPMLALAHPDHHEHSGFTAGFIHPFTGLDHMMMAISLGVLFYSAMKRWKIAGTLIMVLALICGFALGTVHFIPEHFAEYGIVASLIAVAIALWSKSRIILPVATAMLVTFHGIAHGAELGQTGHLISLVLGMVVAMSLIYTVGLLLGKIMEDHLPYGKKIVGVFAGAVALIGLV